jgi:hypothetical protein
LGISSCVVFGFLAAYIGLLLGKVRNDMHPECVSYMSLGASRSSAVLSNIRCNS